MQIPPSFLLIWSKCLHPLITTTSVTVWSQPLNPLYNCPSALCSGSVYWLTSVQKYFPTVFQNTNNYTKLWPGAWVIFVSITKLHVLPQQIFIERCIDPCLAFCLEAWEKCVWARGKIVTLHFSVSSFFDVLGLEVLLLHFYYIV